jgi:ubiquinone/menaquinone biosynthesis C-methylase UbiE
MKHVYWNSFYKKFNLKKPSSFARFVFKRLKTNSLLLEVGCGNGRDTFYFLRNNIRCIAYDISKVAIKNNAKLLKKVFYVKNICKKNNKLKKNYFDCIYARFFLHAINETEQKFFFLNSKNILKKNGILYLEFRTIKDNLFKKGKIISQYERITDHYRRFIDPYELIEDLKKNYSFKIIYSKSSTKFAIFNKQKPHVCRLILKKI